MTQISLPEVQDKIAAAQKTLEESRAMESASFKKHLLRGIFCLAVACCGPIAFTEGTATIPGGKTPPDKTDTRSIQMQWKEPKAPEAHEPWGSKEFTGLSLFALGALGFSLNLRRGLKEQNAQFDIQDGATREITALEKDLSEAWLAAGCPATEKRETAPLPDIKKTPFKAKPAQGGQT